MPPRDLCEAPNCLLPEKLPDASGSFLEDSGNLPDASRTSVCQLGNIYIYIREEICVYINIYIYIYIYSYIYTSCHGYIYMGDAENVEDFGIQLNGLRIVLGG